MRYFGATYYPELVPHQEWEADIAHMADAGMNVVRLAESAWTFLEPQEGQFAFAWLADAIALCQRYGIAVVLGTPTYMPPPWLVHTYPEILPHAADGRRMGLGGRHHYCLHSERYVEATQRIVRAMAESFGDHQNVIGWQLHNEIGLSTCYCERCARAWHHWLRRRYDTIQDLNDAWSNQCWGRLYVDFDQIPLPSAASEPPEGRHVLPLILAHRRFRSDAIRRYHRVQIDELRGRIGNRWLTHNAMGLDLCHDHFDLFADLDIAAWDNYPPLQGGWRRAAVSHGLYRRLKQRPHWVMEQMCGSFGDGEIAWAGQPAPGELSRWVLHSYVHGAEAVLFWLWRSMPGGNWPYWQGLLTPGGQPTERFEEIRRLGHELQALRPIVEERADHAAGQEPERRIATVLSYDNLWALERDRGAPTFSTVKVLDDLSTAVAALGLSMDVVSPLADFTPYAVVIVPALSLVKPDIALNIARYVDAGGIVVLPPRTGRYTWEGMLPMALAPGPLAGLCGIQVRDYDVLLDEREVRLVGETLDVTGRWWCDLIEPATARTVATYADGRYAGRPAITWNRYGRGSVVCLGTYLTDRGYQDVLTKVVHEAGIGVPWQMPPGCEVTRLRDLTFLFNHTSEDRTVWLPSDMVGMGEGMGEATVPAGPVTLPPNHVMVLRDAR